MLTQELIPHHENKLPHFELSILNHATLCSSSYMASNTEAPCISHTPSLGFALAALHAPNNLVPSGGLDDHRKVLP